MVTCFGHFLERENFEQTTVTFRGLLDISITISYNLPLLMKSLLFGPYSLRPLSSISKVIRRVCSELLHCKLVRDTWRPPSYEVHLPGLLRYRVSTLTRVAKVLCRFSGRTDLVTLSSPHRMF